MVADTPTSVAPAGARRHRPFLALPVIPQVVGRRFTADSTDLINEARAERTAEL